MGLLAGQVFALPHLLGSAVVGIYSEYLDRNFTVDQLVAERKLQLRRISILRKRDVLTFAANLQNSRQPIAINYTDLLPIQDQISNLKGESIDIILETPGGSGETVEDIVKLLRAKYKSIGVIVPGIAKSAGTIFAMAADEILMEPMSALGPIDAQMTFQGKTFSAHALLQGMNKIKEEVEKTGTLNKAYVPILQNISPGELQHAENAYDFALVLVVDWLVRYKFKDWTSHRSSGAPVTAAERKQRAQEIAEQLRDHGQWKTHGRSIKIDDLRAMRLDITDYTSDPDLSDAIRRYYTLLQMTLQSNVFKLFETPDSQVMRMETMVAAAMPGMGVVPPGTQVNAALVNVGCARCKREVQVHAAFEPGATKPPNAVLFPANNKLICRGCGNALDLTDARRTIEAQAGRPILSGGDNAAAV